MSETEFVALCLETLGQGAVQSYIDLMYIAAEGSLTLKQLRTIRDHLLAAEQGRRRGDAAAVSNAFIALSELFKGLGRMRMGLFFMDRLLEVARLTGDRKSEMRARHELGAAEEELGNDEAALMHHHAHRELATAAADEEGKAQACRHLAAVFARQAKEHEKKGEHAKALELYLASLEAADSTNDDVTVADASYSAGRSYCVNGQADAAVPLFQAFLRLCLSSEALHERELTAYAALAAAQLAAGNWDAATECLEEVVNAPDADGRLLAEANEQLGLIAARRGKVEEAARCLEGSFENWRALQGTEWADRSRLEKSRMLLGFVKASGPSTERFFSAAVNNDVSALLNWRRSNGASFLSGNGNGNGNDAIGGSVGMQGSLVTANASLEDASIAAGLGGAMTARPMINAGNDSVRPPR